MRKRHFFLLAIAGLTAALWAWNSSWIAGPINGAQTKLIAHRGVHQTHHYENITNDSCTARMILPSSHDTLENTPASVIQAIENGADIVEIDIAQTADNQLAVFHDWTLDCRTNGSGPIRDKTMDELSQLDIGHGYTFDDGATFPFRGKYLGQLLSLETFAKQLDPERTKLLINFKSNDAAEGALLLTHIEQSPALKRMVTAVYGGPAPVAEVTQQLQAVQGFTPRATKTCLINYILLGWSGHVPASCRDTYVSVPANFAWLMWGWPHRFEKRIAAHNSKIILLGPMDPREVGTRGIDTIAQLGYVPQNFDGYVWTNHIERIGSALTNRMAD